MLVKILELATSNFLSPAILSFALGIFAGFVRSDLHIPEQISKAISIYLMFAIGFNGGIELRHDLGFEILFAIVIAIGLSFFIPFLANFILRNINVNLDSKSRAVVAAHYGSISIVTFVTAMQFLKMQGLFYEKHLIAMAALMESPAIIAGVYLIKRKSNSIDEQSSKLLLKEVFFSGSIILLLGGIFIGLISDVKGVELVKPIFSAPLKAILCFFLLDMGLLVAKRFVGFNKLGWRLMMFGIYMPIIGAVTGLGAGYLLGLSVGGISLLATLAASASYIAVPAAMRIAAPEVNPSIYLSLSLVVTFSFNITIGIPTYLIVAKYLKTAL